MKNNFHHKIDPTIIVITSFLMICFFYRLVFFLDPTPRYLINSKDLLILCTFGFIQDIFLATALGGIAACILFFGKSFRPQKYSRLLGTLFIIIFLFLISCILIGQKILFSKLMLGLDFQLFMNSLSNGFTAGYYVDFVSWQDIAFLLGSVLIYPVLSRLPEKIVLAIFISFLSIMVIGVNYSIINIKSVTPRSFLNIIHFNPILYSVFKAIDAENKVYEHEIVYPSKQQMNTIKLVDKDFINYSQVIPSEDIKPISTTKWNIIILVLESAGFEYVFSPLSNKIPMPFLKELSTKGWWLENSYAPGNCSVLSEFGLFTGLYPNTQSTHFERLPKLNIPHLSEFLGKKYDSLFVTPSTWSIYQVRAFKNKYKEFYDFDNLSSNEKKKSNTMVDEEETFKFFISKLKASKPPFLSVYWSSAGHFPYLDYADYRLSHHTENKYDRYINNLFLLDNEIKQVYELMQEKKWQDNTVLIILGDHGQGFGQHPGSYMHGTKLYQEIVKVPVLLYQPKLFKPKRITRMTSIIDILPTLLDATSTAYDANQFQGESLFRPHPQRKYLYIYNELDELASIDQEGNKLQISFREDYCKVFNLKHDPLELKPLSCENYSKQKNALLEFRNFQSKLLISYNKGIL